MTKTSKDIAAALGQYAHDNGREADEADVAEASDLNYKMQLALYDKLGNTLWDNKKYLYLMNCIYGLSNSRTYEIRK